MGDAITAPILKNKLRLRNDQIWNQWLGFLDETKDVYAIVEALGPLWTC